MDGFVTFGALMGLEAIAKQDIGSGGDVLLIFCPSGETAGKVDVTARMLELACMGFQFVAITRWDPQDTSYYVICAKEETLSEAVKNAILMDAGDIVRDATKGFELWEDNSTDNNNHVGLNKHKTGSEI